MAVLRQGVRRGIPDNLSAIVADPDATNPRSTDAFVEYAQARGFVVPHPRVAGSAARSSSWLVDDYSRLLVHGWWTHEENTRAGQTTLRSAIMRRGVPEQLYVDNGDFAGTAEPLVIGRHVHRGRPPGPATPAAATGIDYLGLVLAAHDDATAGSIAYREVPLFPPEEDSDDDDGTAGGDPPVTR